MKIISRKTGKVREIEPSAWSRMVSTGQARYFQVVKEQPEKKVFQRIEPVIQEEEQEKPKRKRRKAFDLGDINDDV